MKAIQLHVKEGGASHLRQGHQSRTIARTNHVQGKDEAAMGVCRYNMVVASQLKDGLDGTWCKVWGRGEDVWIAYRLAVGSKQQLLQHSPIQLRLELQPACARA
jgi:hypothetical protein